LNGSYTYNTDGSTVDAYIFDTGILLNHNEFTGRVRTGFDAITSGGNANDGNGHGSHVAGTVGGTLYGIAKRVSLVAVKVLGDSGSGTLSGVVAGVDWAAGDHTTKPAVGNMSLGSGFSQTVNDAVKRAVADGIVMVVAAGNNNANAANYSPASTLEAITVGATTSTDARASYSNFGSVLDIFAPGSSITSAWYTSSTATSTISGTSMASPHVAGVAALYLEAYPGSTPAQVQDGLKASATANVVTSPGTGSPNLLLFSGSFSGGGGGTPTAPAAPALLSPTNGATGRPITNSAVSWSTSAGATSYTVELSTSTSFATPLQSQTGLTATSASFSGLTALTTYYWRVGATNSVGTTWSATWSFTTALAVPTLSLPSNAAINVPLTPTFTWNSTGAATYDIQVATRSNFTSSSIVVNRTAVAGTSFTQTTALRSRTTHYWRVRSRAANGTTSAWSAGRSFTTL
jgi:subtilisin family serine protease